MELIITSHAQQRMDQHGIAPEQVKVVIQRGAKFPQTDGMVAVYTYIRVAYKIVGEKYIIKTVMIQR
mgnify:CR=1 FL=1